MQLRFRDKASPLLYNKVFLKFETFLINNYESITFIIIPKAGKVNNVKVNISNIILSQIQNREFKY